MGQVAERVAHTEENATIFPGSIQEQRMLSRPDTTNAVEESQRKVVLKIQVDKSLRVEISLYGSFLAIIARYQPKLHTSPARRTVYILDIGPVLKKRVKLSPPTWEDQSTKVTDYVEDRTSEFKNSFLRDVLQRPLRHFNALRTSGHRYIALNRAQRMQEQEYESPSNLELTELGLYGDRESGNY
ncbi:uncharacterized protein BT62DRAFT_921395 [Guyanagaster necrorhizus]|uniref:Uncharacterized protein n=1 Tax=Guyanagaster necrorhizus TaxID=856835 RepID=A0A9P7VMW0_9AGAR|nr:uncharacterized protein BT62DRAFT_921395 [Guyanagaster necrorhizus MCA 3950]KAG7444118.1 hypothetical protein BT62DRAFT_921395 [Guyanagaster necrorhizus MCA 3950]